MAHNGRYTQKRIWRDLDVGWEYIHLVQVYMNDDFQEANLPQIGEIKMSMAGLKGLNIMHVLNGDVILYTEKECVTVPNRFAVVHVGTRMLTEPETENLKASEYPPKTFDRPMGFGITSLLKP